MRHLRLKGVGLDQCPEGIERLNKLETLDLSDNRIGALEQSTASLFKLKKLDLSGNNIPVRVMQKVPSVTYSACLRSAHPCPSNRLFQTHASD